MGVDFTQTGFEWQDGYLYGGTMIYIAIRRPNKPPEAGTDVFKAHTYTGDNNSARVVSTSFSFDGNGGLLWIKAKSGGEQTIFEGDEDIGRWDRLVNMTSDEVRATLNTFPMLRDMPMNQFQNLTAGVVLEIENIIKKEEAQDNAVSRALRIDRQLAYYNDLLGKATEGDTGFMKTRVLSKLASRFTISQERIREIIAELEANRKVLEDANPNLEELIKIEKLKDD
jgi:hypothetical protein